MSGRSKKRTRRSNSDTKTPAPSPKKPRTEVASTKFPKEDETNGVDDGMYTNRQVGQAFLQLLEENKTKATKNKAKKGNLVESHEKATEKPDVHVSPSKIYGRFDVSRLNKPVASTVTISKEEYDHLNLDLDDYVAAGNRMLRNVEEIQSRLPIVMNDIRNIQNELFECERLGKLKFRASKWDALPSPIYAPPIRHSPDNSPRYEPASPGYTAHSPQYEPASPKYTPHSPKEPLPDSSDEGAWV